MSEASVLPPPRILKIINMLREKSINDLKGKDKRDALLLLNDPQYRDFGVRLLGVLDYRAYYQLPKDKRRELYFIFMDIKDTARKNRIAEYLKDRRITSFNLASDMDVVAIVLSTELGAKRLADHIGSSFGTDIEFHIYRAHNPLCLERIRPRAAPPDMSQLQQVSPSLISHAQVDYSDKSLESHINVLKQERVLIGHSVIYNFPRLNQLRDFAMFFNVPSVNAEQFLRVNGFSGHIIDLYEIRYVYLHILTAQRDYKDFYSGATYLGLLEFSNTMERSVWEKMSGTIFPGSNVFFHEISNCIYPGPYAATDTEYDERCEQYAKGDIVPLGHPSRDGESRSEHVGLCVSSVGKNGFILGKSLVGKSTTALRLVEGLLKKKLTVNWVNMTKDLLDTVKKEFGKDVTEHQISELTLADEGFNKFKGGLHVFHLEPSKDDATHSEMIINAIKRIPQVGNATESTSANGCYPISSVLVIDEGHDILAGPSSRTVIPEFAKILQVVRHHSMSVYIITQRLSHLKTNGESLVPMLENRIFHQMSEDEARNAKNLILRLGGNEDSLYDIEEEITGLQPGAVFLRFLDQSGKALAPLKVQMSKDRFA